MWDYDSSIRPQHDFHDYHAEFEKEPLRVNTFRLTRKFIIPGHFCPKCKSLHMYYWAHT